jgi:hypothetical protein
MSRFKEHYHSEITPQFEMDIPEYPLQGVLYIIGEKKFLWCIVLKCPCGCGDLIHLNLLKKANPRWTFFIRKKKITLYPSVWREKGCRSHFVIRRNRVIMIAEYFLNSDTDKDGN